MRAKGHPVSIRCGWVGEPSIRSESLVARKIPRRTPVLMTRQLSYKLDVDRDQALH